MKERKVPMLIMEKVRNVGLIDEGLPIKLEVQDEDGYNVVKRIPPLAAIRNGGRVSAKPLDKIISLGQTFQSFAEVSHAITMYEKRHKVHLMQKYFRRIAANPKPSNKEDFMLSEDERKRFVYRWVDFCCTYFDDILARTDHNDEGGNGSNNQVLGLAMRECPMRIRFQLRFNEKDLLISIFKEEHDHKHTTSSDIPQMSPLPKNTNEKVIVPVASISDLKNTKRPRPPPPSLTPLPPPKFPKEAATVPYSESSSSNSQIRCKNVTTVNSQLLSQNLSIPKPPPLKAMPSLSSGAETSISSNEHVPELSVEGVIKNIYQFLYQLQTQGPRKESGLQFTSPNPDLIKITSELSGVDTGQVLATCQPKEALHGFRNSRNNKKSVQNSCLVLQTNCSSVPSLNNRTINRVETTGSISNRNFSDIAVPSSNNARCQSQRSYDRLGEEDNETRFMNMPVEVIIKAEPDEPVNFYDENDSDSNMDMSINDNYFQTERADANR